LALGVSAAVNIEVEPGGLRLFQRPVGAGSFFVAGVVLESLVLMVVVISGIEDLVSYGRLRGLISGRRQSRIWN
jgi:hypothetical protein